MSGNTPTPSPLQHLVNQLSHADRAGLVLLLIFAVAPFVVPMHIVSELTRVLIYGLAACAVGFAVRHGGLVSFGHAAFFGYGAYIVLMARQAGFQDAMIIWPVGLASVAVLALFIGFLSLKTRGVAFIMITLGFAQMVFFIFSGIQALGASDGIGIANRDTIAGHSINSTTVFHYVSLCLTALTLWVLQKISASPAGLVLRGIANDEKRLRALGFAPARLLLNCFIVSAMIAGLAGMLAANFYYFVSPAYLHWMVSGELLVMIALGGIGSAYGGLFGALVLILAEVILSQYSTYWRIILGPAIVVSVLYFPNGLHPALNKVLGGKS